MMFMPIVECLLCLKGSLDVPGEGMPSPTARILNPTSDAPRWPRPGEPASTKTRDMWKNILASHASVAYNEFMAKKRTRFSDEIRAAVERSGLSRYAICKELGIPQSSMSRFMSGENWLGQDTLDALAELLDLHVSAGKPRRKK